MPGARFSLCRYHPNGGDKVRGGSGGHHVPPEWGNRRGIDGRRLLERHPLSAVILLAYV